VSLVQDKPIKIGRSLVRKALAEYARNHGHKTEAALLEEGV
jgi:hypothetical protein